MDIKRLSPDDRDYEHCQFHIPVYIGDSLQRDTPPTLKIKYTSNGFLFMVLVVCDKCLAKLSSDIEILQDRELSRST